MSDGRTERGGGSPPTGRIVLVALFMTALVTAQLTASKVLMFGLPFELPVVGGALFLPGAAFAYALTFFGSDCYAELYGHREARIVVNVGFAMNFVLFALVWSTILAPAAPFGVDPGQFRTVLGASTSVILGSMLAYLISQNWDVIAFEKIREYTDGDHLWARNIGSTASSQAIDTVIFIVVAFALGPALLRGQAIPPIGQLLGLIVGQYILKLLIAFGDTPFVYAVVGYLRQTESITTPTESAR